jgi:phage shock protein C
MVRGGNMATRLFRSGKDKMIAGVCGGIAEYFDIDSAWVRLIAVVLVFAGGIGIPMYIIAWIIIPMNPAHRNSKDTEAEKMAKQLTEKVEKVQEERDISRGRLVAGGLLVIIGAGLLFDMIFPRFDFKFIWPVLLIAAGALILWRRSR